MKHFLGDVMLNVTEMAVACPANHNPLLFNLNSEQAKQELPWFALRIRERYRALCEHMLDYNEFEFFSPCCMEERTWSDRRKLIKVPLFSGYIFCRLDPSQSLRVLKTPGVMEVVSAGRKMLEVNAQEIAAIQTALSTRRPIEAVPYIAVGERCRIMTGPLRGLEGVVERHKGGARLLLSVEMLNRSVSVEIDAREIV